MKRTPNEVDQCAVVIDTGDPVPSDVTIERKGREDSDTLADHLAEPTSLADSRHMSTDLGTVLHHNFADLVQTSPYLTFIRPDNPSPVVSEPTKSRSAGDMAVAVTPSDRSVVAVAIDDGFFGCTAGAGYTNRAFLEVLAEMLPPLVDLVIMPVEVSEGSQPWEARWHHDLEETLRQSRGGVQIRRLSNPHGKTIISPAPGDFAWLAPAVQAEVARLRRSYRRGLVVLSDIAFCEAAAKLGSRAGFPTVLVPRTSSLLAHPEATSTWVAWEQHWLRRAVAGGVRIAAISSYMRSLLTTVAGLPSGALVDLSNGVTTADLRVEPSGEFHLPIRSGGFWLAMGRAVVEKGFDDLVDALCLLRQRGVSVPHVVLAAVSTRTEPTAYQRRIASRIIREGLDVSVLTSFSPAVRGLLRHPDVHGVIVPSRVEPFGRIPLEAYAAGAAPVVATSAGGLAELVVDGETGFLARPSDPESLATALTRAATISTAARERMRERGRAMLCSFDYRDSVERFLRAVAPWLMPTSPWQGGAESRSSVPGSPQSLRGVSVLQIPEVCGWNNYVAAGEAALAAGGVRVLRPGLCIDASGGSETPGTAAVGPVDGPTVVHLHWPEKLARQLGPARALALLNDLANRGAVIAQTVHNVRPHEPTPALADFQQAVDRITTGVHFFSAAHEAVARPLRPLLPTRHVLHMPHPQYPTVSIVGADAPSGSVGCFGRLRGYKGTVDFARTLLDSANRSQRLIIAGSVDDLTIHEALSALAADGTTLDYRPGFIDDETAFWQILASVDWVALPYQRLYSSGVLVAALQAGRRVVSPTPIGGTGLYVNHVDSDRWITIDPWNDAQAVTALRRSHTRRRASPGRRQVLPGRLALPTWSQAAEILTRFYTEIINDGPAAAQAASCRSTALPDRKVVPPVPGPVPLHIRHRDGEPFDFGTHSNDFLLKREDSHATETFVVRVPGGGAVPEHVHTDMEQTFVFVAGIGEATLTCEGRDPRQFVCRPGDVVFVPAGWRHTVVAGSAEGLVYVTIDAFLPGAERIGDSALSHAAAVQPAFADIDQAPAPVQQPDPLATFRAAETAFAPGGLRMWPCNFTAFDSTLLQDPSSYRVRRVGPFEYVTPVRPGARILTADLADALFAAASSTSLAVYVEGSQSPISAKRPCEASDLDIIVAINNHDDLNLARKALDAIAAQMDLVPLPLSLGVVHTDWLELPNFYTALSLDPVSPDRQWWAASDEECRAEADRRIRRGLALLERPQAIAELLSRSLETLGVGDEFINEWRLIPRWQGYV